METFTLTSSATILDVKDKFVASRRKFYPDRQSFRAEPRGKAIADDATLASVGLTSGGKLYFKDLGPQIGWSTVFICEYAGPLFVYLSFYWRPAIIYGAKAAAMDRHAAVQIAAAAWCFHYAKRVLETIFIHRFSHSTMPIRNLFKNCSYYWGFSAFISYFVNHPQYTAPVYGDMQLYGGLLCFALSQLGNFSIHLAFRQMRPAGSKVRVIPRPSANPFTWLFALVSCPNYTYEFGSWLSFSVLSQSFPALLFTIAGMYQMSVWALGKHRNYKREFKDYPRGRRAILPIVL